MTLQLWQQKLRTMPWLLSVWQRSPVIVAGLMVVLLAQLAAQLSWQWLTPSLAPLPSNAVTTPTANHQSVEENLNEVVNAHLFGKVDAVVNKGPITAPVTRLRLNLNGVFASENPKLAMAIISDSSGEQKHYRIGDAVPGGARLHAIYPDRVILDRLGKLETLKLPREVAPINATTITPSTTVNNTQLPTASARVHKVEASEKVKQLRDKMINAPQEVWKEVRIEPVMANGVIQGYRFAHNDRRLMQSLGLTADDVIVEINGMTLSDPSVLYDLMQQITTMDNVSLTIKRKGQTETIEVRM